ncbi:uncharacterized protein ACIQIH_008469 isoform 2-T9 [Cyanocitta cristata]
MAVPLFHTEMSVLLYMGYLLCSVNPLFLPSVFRFCPGSLPAFSLSTPALREDSWESLILLYECSRAYECWLLWGPVHTERGPDAGQHRCATTFLERASCKEQLFQWMGHKGTLFSFLSFPRHPACRSSTCS